MNNHAAKLAKAHAIIRLAAEYFGHTEAELLGLSRKQPLVWSRQVAMWAARQITGLTTLTLGEVFHRDHGTIIHACRLVNERISYDTGAARESGELLASALRALNDDHEVPALNG